MTNINCEASKLVSAIAIIMHRVDTTFCSNNLHKIKFVTLDSNPISVGMGPDRPILSGENIGHEQKMTNVNCEPSK
jgi:hypothetical protein